MDLQKDTKKYDVRLGALNLKLENGLYQLRGATIDRHMIVFRPFHDPPVTHRLTGYQNEVGLLLGFCDNDGFFKLPSGESGSVIHAVYGWIGHRYDEEWIDFCDFLKLGKPSQLEVAVSKRFRCL